MEFKFKEKTLSQLKQNYYNRVKNELNAFIDFDDFNKWYIDEPKKCRYYGINEEKVQKIVVLGLLKSKRFPLNGLSKQGRARGMWLEVDRYDSNKKYSRENCVLACYFCNNDKSDVFDGKQYLEFFQNRLFFLENLID